MRLLLTIGHSNHPIEHFIGLLKRHGLTAIADVRSSPYSRSAHFNREPLCAVLKREGLDYVFLGRELGARREEPECYDNGQVDLRKVAQLPIYQQGLQRLEKGIERCTVALLCAEKEPLDCHRAVLICRSLCNKGVTIKHILGDGNLEDHKDTERRMVKMMEAQASLFQQGSSQESLVERAYDERAKEIAYRKEEAEKPPLVSPVTSATKIRLFTMGFAGKPAKVFFNRLRSAGVKRLVDIRLNNASQLAGFTKKQDLEFFLKEIAGIEYVHRPELAPTKEILDAYRKRELDWPGYERRFLELLSQRRPEDQIRPNDINMACLLCTEPKPDKCHRRLTAEYFRGKWSNVEIQHL